MSTNFSVRVVDEDGNPREDVKLWAYFGIMHGGITQFTDDDGWATFTSPRDYSSVEIYINGDSHGDHSISEGKTFSFTVED